MLLYIIPIALIYLFSKLIIFVSNTSKKKDELLCKLGGPKPSSVLGCLEFMKGHKEFVMECSKKVLREDSKAILHIVLVWKLLCYLVTWKTFVCCK